MNLPFKIDLKGKVAVITGGSGAICRQFGKSISTVWS